jgi:hypothetical protein
LGALGGGLSSFWGGGLGGGLGDALVGVLGGGLSSALGGGLVELMGNGLSGGALSTEVLQLAPAAASVRRRRRQLAQQLAAGALSDDGRGNRCICRQGLRGRAPESCAAPSPAYWGLQTHLPLKQAPYSMSQSVRRRGAGGEQVRSSPPLPPGLPASRPACTAAGHADQLGAGGGRWRWPNTLLGVGAAATHRIQGSHGAVVRARDDALPEVVWVQVGQVYC